MLKQFNFLNTTIVFLVGLIFFYAFKSQFQLSILYVCIWIFLFIVIQSLGAYFIRLNFHLMSINSLITKDKKVCLTFDDGPHNPNTLRVLEVLKKHKVTALFCVIGKNVSGNESILQQIKDEGHELANHSFSHAFWFDTWSKKKVINDLGRCQDLIKNYQLTPGLFRPPYGVTNPNIAWAVKKLNLKSIGWTIRSYDTSIKDIEKINQRIVSQLKPGAIILLHDRLDFMPQLLEDLIPAIKEKGYSLASFDTTNC